MVRSFPDLNANWLVVGDGFMRKSDNVKEVQKLKNIKKIVVFYDDNSFEECGDYEVCDEIEYEESGNNSLNGNNWRIWAESIVYDVDRTDLLEDIANSTGNQPNYAMLIGAIQGQKVMNLIGFDGSGDDLGRPVKYGNWRITMIRWKK